MRPPIKVTLIYLTVGYIWILFSDQFLLLLFEGIEVEAYAIIQSYKGFFFVTVTALMLFLLTNHYHRSISANVKKLEIHNRDFDREAIHLSQANRNLEQFSYVISHDLQEPVQVLRLTLRQLIRKYEAVLDEKGVQYLRNAEKSTVDMREIINKMYNYYEVSAYLSDEVSTVDLNVLMEDIRRWNARLIQKKKGVFTWDKLPLIRVNQNRLFRLFEILVRNSFLYSDENTRPTVRVSCSEQEQYLVFSVKDNGPGIPEDLQSHIFVLFSPDKDGDLTGRSSGLAIVHKIVTGLDGQISFTSSPETGTTFTIYLPKSLLQTPQNDQ
ncbi:Histidine kinase-, DNA gyrase B-, and HSP90-like ATPase [Cyclonatronum proteinivorum]|uniref:histidine kinase n=1 Tax=Cyclonatronum proteinivorum TaxID=1457365 RepID=A0A345UKI2_9BACT|nr:HAMP domain-containing sensor histidine kinase [Cyclonatronum proteinivorum]AXJ00984.1 Histidine kinase-, DNA gyrase B-, and HSP90-like ATPase [Cyclonatronum proteinivorum]